MRLQSIVVLLWRTSAGLGKLLQWKSHLQKTTNASETQNQVVVTMQTQYCKKCKFCIKWPTIIETQQTHYLSLQVFVRFLSFRKSEPCISKAVRILKSFQSLALHSGVAWAIWLRMQFLVCVSMTSLCSVNSGTICLQKLPSNCDLNTMLYLSEFQLLHTGPDLADARP